MLAIHPPRLADRPQEGQPTHTALAEALWIDLSEPTAEEVAAVQDALGIEMPTRSEMQEIEMSSRLYAERGALFMTATVIHRATTEFPETAAITFVLTGKHMVTVRYADPTPFRTFAPKADRNYISYATRDKMFGGLIDEIIDRVADILELAGSELDAISRAIFAVRAKTEAAPNYTAMLERIGRCGDLAAKARESLVTLSRVASFYIENQRANSSLDLDEHWRTIRSDLASLSEHASFLNSKTNFFLDATLGMINIEQNSIIKIFSVAAVVFLPPTLVASVYGMNFDFMPETHWPLGYPFAIILMIVSAVLPCLYFKRKGWL